jgi:hypothetical protein
MSLALRSPPIANYGSCRARAIMRSRQALMGIGEGGLPHAGRNLFRKQPNVPVFPCDPTSPKTIRRMVACKIFGHYRTKMFHVKHFGGAI